MPNAKSLSRSELRTPRTKRRWRLPKIKVDPAERILPEEAVLRMMDACLIAAPEGLAALADSHPGVPVYVAAIDRQLDDHGYIRPGLGDAGDRLYGTR